MEIERGRGEALVWSVVLACGGGVETPPASSSNDAGPAPSPSVMQGDRSKLGATCTPGYAHDPKCHTDEECVAIQGELRCAREPCDAVRCPAGQACGSRPSIP